MQEENEMSVPKTRDDSPERKPIPFKCHCCGRCDLSKRSENANQQSLECSSCKRIVCRQCYFNVNSWSGKCATCTATIKPELLDHCSRMRCCSSKAKRYVVSYRLDPMSEPMRYKHTATYEQAQEAVRTLAINLLRPFDVFTAEHEQCPLAEFFKDWNISALNNTCFTFGKYKLSIWISKREIKSNEC